MTESQQHIKKIQPVVRYITTVVLFVNSKTKRWCTNKTVVVIKSNACLTLLTHICCLSPAVTVTSVVARST